MVTPMREQGSVVKRLINTADARVQLQDGIDQVANIVKQTLGVKGRNVALDTNKYAAPLLTNDGVSIAHQLHFEDDFVELGAKLIKEAAHKTEDNAGDGTTTTMIIMQSLVDVGMKMMAQGRDPLELRAEIEDAVNYVVDYVRKAAKPAKDEETLAYAATISCRDPKIGRLVAKCVARAKEDGMISLEDNLGGKTEVDELEGLQLRTGYVAKQFINQPALNQVLITNPAVIVTNLSLSTPQELQYIAEQAMKQGTKVLAVFAQDIGHEFMLWAYANWANPQAPFKLLPIRFNTSADIAEGILKDVAAVSGAHFIDSFLGEQLDVLEQEGAIGRVKKLVQTKTETTVLPSNKQLVEARVKDLKAEWSQAKDFQAENIQERIARLRSACFTIKVGGSTETELRERKTRVQDALNTARAAYSYGVVKGGGLTLAEAAKKAPALIADACFEPCRQQAKNSNVTYEAWWETVKEMPEVLDAAKVVTEAVMNAAAQAIQVLLVETLVVDPEVNQ